MDVSWLAGLMEGEGSFMKGPPSSPNQPVLSLVMTDKDVVQRAADILGANVFVVPPRKEHWKITYGIKLRGEPACFVLQRQPTPAKARYSFMLRERLPSSRVP